MSLRYGFVLATALLIAACAPLAGAPRTAQPQDAGPAATRTPPPTATLAPSQDLRAAAYGTLIDSQGSVTFEITPIDLSPSAESLDFEVVMNTHSVDLAWDLAAQAILRSDTGRELTGQSWPVGSGHHYSGILSFSNRTSDGLPFLEGAKSVALVLRDTDVPERQFTWEVRP